MDMSNKYMALFFHTVSMFRNEILDVGTEEFEQELFTFIMNYYENDSELFNKVFGIIPDGNGGYTYELDYEGIMKYAMYIYNPKKIASLYDEIGNDMVEKITDLAELYWHYELIIDDLNNGVRIRH